MIISILLIILGFGLLIKGADFLVAGASNVAKKFHISDIIIGLTIVSIGTSLPELLVSISFALQGYPDMIIGNIIGSNISNVLLILGVSALIKPISFNKETILIELPMFFAVSIIFMSLCNIGKTITRLDATVLLTLFIIFIIYTIALSPKSISNKTVEKSKKVNLIIETIYILIGSILLKIGGDITTNNAINLAHIFNLSEKITSIVILSVGTSLPEFVTSISVALKGKSDIAIGNILGSNMFNMLLVVGFSSLIHPISYNTSYNVEMIILVFSILTLFLFPILPPKNKISRDNGFLCFVVYMAYITSLFV